jgi:conjugative transfer signal peptidase TraF
VARLITLLIMFSATGGLLVTMARRPIPALFWNASESAPLGLYVTNPGRLAVKDLVVAMPGEPLATFLAEGSYLPRGVPLIKRVLAVAGQRICRVDVILTIDGIEIGSARERDNIGRLLPRWQGCRVVGAEEIFLMNVEEPESLDGRYFGTLPRSSILARVVPLWTSEKR